MASRRWRWAGTPEALTGAVSAVSHLSSVDWQGHDSPPQVPTSGGEFEGHSLYAEHEPGREEGTCWGEASWRLSLAVSPQPLWERPRPPVHGADAGPLTLLGVAVRGSNTRQTIIIFNCCCKFSAQSLPCRAPPGLPSFLTLGGGMRAQAVGEG